MTDEALPDDPDRDALLDDERLTLMGLFSESWSGLTRQIEQRLKDECNLSALWFVLLLRIARSPGGRLRMSDLATQMGLSPSGLTRAVDRLEAAGYVERLACPSDRRGAFATLTAEGREVIRSAVGPHLRHLDELLLCVLSPRELDELAAILRKVRDHVNPAAAQPPEPVSETQ